jgi:arylsulfatase A
MRTCFTVVSLSIVVAIALFGPTPAIGGGFAQPHIVVIYADDLGYGDVSCYNPPRGRIPTPHIDSLAAAGMRFTDAHSSSAVCSPSRYTLLTGRYHWRTVLQQGIVGLWGPPLIAPDRLTVAGFLREQGYAAACIGKWHLGWDWPIDAARRPLFVAPANGDQPAIATQEHRAAWRGAFSQPIHGGPITRGFDEYFGTDVPNWPPFCFIEQDRTVGIPSEFLPERLLTTEQASLQGPALRAWTLEPILPALADRACEFIHRAAAGPRPFFLYLPLTSPHTPLSVNREWLGQSGLNLYADFVMETDDVVGRVLEALDQNGVADRTLVLFTSDNGCAPYIGVPDLERMGHFPSGPLRGYKSDIWEGGHRVPFIVRWPGVVEPGGVCDHLVHQADLIATCAEILGTQLPDDAGEDSISFLSLIRGHAEPTRNTGVFQSAGGLLAVREGPWKLILGPGSGGWAPGRDEHPAQLYHLQEDLAESNNRYATDPEKVAELIALMDQLVGDGRSTPGPPLQNDVAVNWRRFLAPAP